MGTAWFNKAAGSVVHESIEDDSMLMVGDVIPDWVRLPAELGGERVRVEGAKTAPCPMCRNHVEVRHLRVTGNLGVAECRQHGFVWYQGTV
jgi:hypothetical protein